MKFDAVMCDHCKKESRYQNGEIVGAWIELRVSTKLNNYSSRALHACTMKCASAIVYREVTGATE